MKTQVKTFLCFSIILLSLGINIAIASGSGIAKKEFSVEPFSKMEIGGPFNVFIRQGEAAQVYVEADEKVISKVRVNTEDETLKIELESFSFNVKKLNVYITLKKVDYIKLYDAGNVECKGVLKLENLEVNYSRTGNMSLNIDCKEFKLLSDGKGNIDISGSASKAVISHSGVGNFNSARLQAEILKINASCVGNTEVYASKEIYLNVSGVGNFEYSGDAVVKEYRVSGVGNISKK